jgi:DNA-binding NarL/FixJ family response regulator
MGKIPLPRVLLVDNEPQVLETMDFILSDLYAVQGFTSGRQAVEAARKHIFPVAVVDLHMDDMSGLEVLREIKAASPFTQVVILTGYACMDSAISALNHDAYRYLIKPFVRDIFLEALSGAMKAYEAALLAHERLSIKPMHLEDLGLSPRLAQVARGILEGYSNEEIARQLNIAPRTVEKHVERLLAHFHISSRFLLEAQIIKTLRRMSGWIP